jgi:hypothetical protein
MTFFSLTQASSHLGIDVKTLHRWLADAELPLQRHPSDGRKKGISEEHLQVLAHVHQRQLTGTLEDIPAQLSCQTSTLPANLLWLSERLDTLQAQIAALHASVADLTSLLQQREQASASQTTPAPSASSATPSAKRTRSASAPAKKPAKPVHVIPRVECDEQGQYVVICPKKGLLPLEPDTQEWFAWVSQQDAFRFVGKGGSFTAHHEARVPKGAWRAHRKIRNHSDTLRLAPNHELTIAVLEHAAETLQTHLMEHTV